MTKKSHDDEPISSLYPQPVLKFMEVGEKAGLRAGRVITIGLVVMSMTAIVILAITGAPVLAYGAVALVFLIGIACCSGFRPRH